MSIWIARDKDGTLCLHQYVKPALYNGKDWAVSHPEYEKRKNYSDRLKEVSTSYYELDEYELPEVTFENSPQRVQVTVVKENKRPVIKRKDLLYNFYNDKTKEELIEILLKCNGLLAEKIIWKYQNKKLQ